MKQVLGDRRAIIAFLAPALTLYTVLVLVPIVWSMGYTFVDGNPIKGFTWVGLTNYTDMVADPSFWSSLRVTVVYAVVVTAGQVTAGLGLALLYTFYLRRSSALIRTLVFLPFILPTAAIAQLFMKLFEIAPQYGLVNSVVVGFGGQASDWLSDPVAAFVIIVIMDVWRAMGFYAILIYAGLADVPSEVIEAARIDGASGIPLVRRVIVPLLTPIIVAAVIFSINSTIKVFDSIYALTGGGPGEATRPLTLDMFATAFRYGRYGDASTLATVLTMMCLLVTIAIYRSGRSEPTG